MKYVGKRNGLLQTSAPFAIVVATSYEKQIMDGREQESVRNVRFHLLHPAAHKSGGYNKVSLRHEEIRPPAIPYSRWSATGIHIGFSLIVCFISLPVVVWLKFFRMYILLSPPGPAGARYTTSIWLTIKEK